MTSQNQPVQQSHTHIPVLPLRDVVIFPHMVIPLFVGREKSIEALDAAMNQGKQIFLVSQKHSDQDEPAESDMYDIGTLSTILQLLKLPDGTIKVLVEGVQRAKLHRLSDENGYFEGDIEKLTDKEPSSTEKTEELTSSLMSQFEQYVKLNKKVPPEVLNALSGIDESGRLADTIAAHLSLKVEDKQHILEQRDVLGRLELVLNYIESEMDMLQVERKLQGRVKQQMEKQHREYYLNEKMKAIQRELGEMEDGSSELDELERKIDEVGMPEDAKEKAHNELKKLRMMSPMSAEATVSRNYLDWLVAVPWQKKSRISRDIKKAERILDEDHYGLEKVKERIIEYLAVQQRSKRIKGPILCLVGPPGVGKTSLGQSIARATGRKFTRFSLGGIRDEAEIRGHRRTYIGALPGKIVQYITKTGVANPLFMLDEVDKMAMDFRGDPASAMLEVLDPEQNYAFHDHYLEVDYDLSKVMFIATANTLDIPPALLDRMEVIRIPGYTEEEKVNIVKRYLIPKQMKEAGLKKKEVKFTEPAIRDVIRHYTREAGVRNVEREVAKICRKVVKEKIKKSSDKTTTVNRRNLSRYLGVRRYRYGLTEEEDRVGQVTGLAWTEVGGDLLTIEATAVPGKGKSQYTGQLGEIMQESIQTALTVVRSRADKLGIEPEFYKNKDVHVHVPEGATPKDGPSAGIGMCTALVSSLTRIPVKSDVGMTGEITLRGEVLPIGGLKEKLLAAKRGGVKTAIIPKENNKDLKEIPKNITQGLNIVPVQWIDEVLELALTKPPEPLQKAVEEQEVQIEQTGQSSDRSGESKSKRHH